MGAWGIFLKTYFQVLPQSHKGQKVYFKIAVVLVQELTILNSLDLGLVKLQYST